LIDTWISTFSSQMSNAMLSLHYYCTNRYTNFNLAGKGKGGKWFSSIDKTSCAALSNSDYTITHPVIGGARAITHLGLFNILTHN
jgi:hypothetical protein